MPARTTLQDRPAANYNRVNINANLDIKLHRYIRARFGLVSTMGIRKSSNYGYSSNYSSEDASSNTTLGVTEFPDIISDINTTPGISFPFTPTMILRLGVAVVRRLVALQAESPWPISSRTAPIPRPSARG